MTGDRMDSISMVDGRVEVPIKFSILGSIPAHLDTRHLMGLCMAVGMIASGTSTNTVSMWVTFSKSMHCTIEAPFSKKSMASLESTGPRLSIRHTRWNLKKVNLHF